MSYIPTAPEWHAVVKVNGQERWFRIAYWIEYPGLTTRAFCPTFSADGAGAIINPAENHDFMRFAYEGDG